ncbi:MAG TPA: hypothetical protein VKX31_08355 [Brumimicrobium sp.]|nr:hypothetical protein [Brumimicrobium sp.]
MKTYFFSLCAIFITVIMTVQTSVVNAQIVDNSRGYALGDNQPFFNPDFIRHRGIKTISGQFIHYKLGDKLRETDFYRIYTFNKKGLLVKREERSQITSGQETVIDLYEYDDKNRMLKHKHFDHFSAYAYTYTYDEKGRMLSKEYRQNYHRGSMNSENYELTEEHIISFEKFRYEDYDNQQHQFVYNQNGEVPYKDVITYFDEKKRITSVVEKLRRVSSLKTTSYYYNEDGFIDSINVNSRSEQFRDLVYSFTYDEKNNLKGRKDYVNGKLTTNYEIVYKEETNLINDVLIQNLQTNFIRILELRNYSYFEQE